MKTLSESLSADLTRLTNRISKLKATVEHYGQQIKTLDACWKEERKEVRRLMERLNYIFDEVLTNEQREEVLKHDEKSR